VENIQEGQWSYQVSAPGHGTQGEIVTVTPDQTALVEPILDRSLVSVRFNVVPVPFTDRYEIQIEQTFETHVPAPVLVFDPPLTRLYYVEPGFEMTTIVKLSNHGLKALDDVTITYADSGEARWEPLISYIPRLGANQTVEIPFRFIYRGPVEEEGLPGNLIDDAAGYYEAGKNIYNEWKKCVDTKFLKTYFYAINNLVATATGHSSCVVGNLENSSDAMAGLDFDVTIDLCSVAKDKCVDLVSYTMDRDYAQKVCDEAYSKLTNAGPIGGAVGIACTVLEKVQKAYDYGKMYSCAEKVLDNHRKKRKKSGDDEGGSPTTGDSLSDWFFSALDPGGGLVDLNGCKTCGPSVTVGVGGPGCFDAGTPILMADGSRQPIETVRPGDLVMSFDGQEAMVSRVHNRVTDHIREIRYKELEGADRLLRIRTTDEHQFWIMNQDRWALARDLKMGDVLMLPQGKEAIIFETVRFPFKTRVYNFDVADYETYFANGALVYQECGGRTAERVDDYLRRVLLGWKSTEDLQPLSSSGNRILTEKLNREAGKISPLVDEYKKGGAE
jgi:hypothetical protein